MHRVFRPERPARAALGRCALIGLICVAAAGCGTASSGQSDKAAGRGQHPANPPGDTACTTAHLDVTLDLKSAGVAAGTSMIPLDFTNVSTSSCKLAGYAWISFASKYQGKRIGPAATADRALAAHALLLGAGKTAHLWLRMVAAADLPARLCRPKKVAGLQVRLPGQAASIFIAHRFLTCAKRVRGTDILTVEPFQAGRARAGTAQ
ncbi:MAG TPA: DUF4232 domain-containing protein [Streptosporangiaceae bacterium]|nr:DUF4232 domain-containing protein [Streptosporangiaceae bacterium]